MTNTEANLLNYSLNIAVLTISDTRTEETDKSGQLLVERLTSVGHRTYTKTIVPDDKYKIRAIVSHWCTVSELDVIITTGGTGLTGRDSTPEAIHPILDKELAGFGELFRVISYNEIGASAIQSRSFAGICNGKFIFCLPGSLHACATAWDTLIQLQLDSRTKPCNLADLRTRLLEK